MATPAVPDGTTPMPLNIPVFPARQSEKVTDSLANEDEETAIRISNMAMGDYIASVKQLAVAGREAALSLLVVSGTNNFGEPLKELALENNAAGVKELMRFIPAFGDISAFQNAFIAAASANAVDALRVMIGRATTPVLGAAAVEAAGSGAIDALKLLTHAGMAGITEDNPGGFRFREDLQKAYKNAVSRQEPQEALVALRALSGKPYDSISRP